MSPSELRREDMLPRKGEEYGNSNPIEVPGSLGACDAV
jgi:hypothetical protein